MFDKKRNDFCVKMVMILNHYCPVCIERQQKSIYLLGKAGSMTLPVCTTTKCLWYRKFVTLQRKHNTVINQ